MFVLRVHVYPHDLQEVLEQPNGQRLEVLEYEATSPRGVTHHSFLLARAKGQQQQHSWISLSASR